jgi:hypothetical protein
MANETIFQSLLSEINAVTPERLQSPYMPIDAFCADAAAVGEAAVHNRGAFEGIGFDGSHIDSIANRVAALRAAEAEWRNNAHELEEIEIQWREMCQEATELRAFLVHWFRYACRADNKAVSRLREIEQGNTQADLMQDMEELANFGQKHADALAAINFDLTMVAKAGELSHAMTQASATSRRESLEDSQLRLLRDKAYTLLKEAVDEVRVAAKALFWRDETTMALFRSGYTRRTRSGEPDEQKEPSGATVGSVAVSH